ncbi:MAG: BLUF domain-containing protein [Janthinobacterium lividum]
MFDEQDEAQRRQAVAWAIAQTAGTALAPDQYEYKLLNDYAQGLLSLEQVLTKLDNRTQHILYRSQARHLFNASQLAELQLQSQTWNKAHQVTGLLCYTDEGHFVQFIEGSINEVRGLYARIQQDPRHHHVTLLSDKTNSTRGFADWQMALINVSTNEFYWLLNALEAKDHQANSSQVPVSDPLLLTLLEQFSQT